MVKDRLADLYPEGALALPVIPRLPVPRMPSLPKETRNRVGYRDYYHPNILAESLVDGTDEILAAVDKAFPHSRFDFMVLVGNDDIRSSVRSVQSATVREILRTCAEFISFISEPESIRRFGLDGAVAMLGTNFDAVTNDRDNGQWWDKRMHWHLNCWPGSDLAGIVSVPLSEVDDLVLRRSLIDPVVFLASDLLRTAFRSGFPLPDECVVEPTDLERDRRLGLPAGLKIRLPGWSFLDSDACVRTLVRVHEACQSVYDDLRMAFTGTAVALEPWYRPKLLDQGTVAANLESMAWIGHDERDRLIRIRRALRNVDESEMHALQKDLKTATSRLALAGLDYNMAFFAPQQNTFHTSLVESEAVYLCLQAKLFSRIGSSPAIGGAVAANLDRSSGRLMTEDELRMRREFQREFLSRNAIWSRKLAF